MHKKIVSKDGSYISVDDDGQIWASQSEKSFSSPGYVCNGIVNVHKLLGIVPKYDSYYGIELKIIKHAKRLGIKKLRALRQSVKDTKVGQLYVIEYGYIRQNKFDSLVAKRKTAAWFNRTAVLLKQSDFKWKTK